MALVASRRRDRGINYWPGFVDALSTLLLSIIMILSIFMLAQYFLSQEVGSKDTALTRLNAQVEELSQLLALQKASGRSLQDQLSSLTDNLASVSADKTRLQTQLTDAQGAAAAGAGAGGQIGALQGRLADAQRISAGAIAQIDLLNQQIAALRRQIATVEAALDTSEARDRDAQVKIADLGSRLNLALAARVQELSRYRSDFFGKLREILGDRPDVRVAGDRFVFQSEVFFNPSQAVLEPEGQAELDKVASAILELQGRIPTDIPWVLRVDGHTDTRPIKSAQYPSNWSLSAARAISVVQYLASKGIPPQRLVAAGFGEFQPIDTADTDDARRRNRRIELKLTER